MKFTFGYMEWQEDEGAEIEMVPCMGCLEKTTMTQPEDFESFMSGYTDYQWFIQAQLTHLEYIERLEEKLAQAKKTGEKEVVFYVEEYSDSEDDTWKFVINEECTRFFKPYRNTENTEHFENTAIPTEFFLALLKEWKKYIASGSQEKKIVEIDFDYDIELYQKTGKVKRRKA